MNSETTKEFRESYLKVNEVDYSIDKNKKLTIVKIKGLLRSKYLNNITK